MSAYPENPELREFLEGFKQRYVFEDDTSRRVIAITGNEAAILGKFLISGIVDWIASPVNDTDDGPSLEQSLEEFVKRCATKPNLIVKVTEEDLKALGAFLMRGIVGLILTLDQARMEVAHTRGKYAGH